MKRSVRAIANKLLEIKVTKATLFIYERELMKLLAQDQELYTKVIKRGKSILRGRRFENPGK